MKTLTRIAAGAAALGLVAGPTVALAEDAKSQSMTIDQYNAQGGQVASFDDAARAVISWESNRERSLPMRIDLPDKAVELAKSLATDGKDAADVITEALARMAWEREWPSAFGRAWTAFSFVYLGRGPLDGRGSEKSIES